MLAKHPKIGSACQEVLQKDGKTYVKFEGEIKKVSKQGTEVQMAMKGGDTITLNPKPDRSVYIGGKKTAVKNLHPGDTLTFYVPEDRLVAAVMETPTAPVEEIQMATPGRAGGDDHDHLRRSAADRQLLAAGWIAGCAVHRLRAGDAHAPRAAQSMTGL